MLAEVPVTAQNWRGHPAIAEVRRIVAGVERRLPVLRAARTRDCEIDSGSEATTLFDRAGRPVRRSVTFGSSDSVETVTATYDSAGRTRFVYVGAGAVNGTHVQYRYYFGARGERLWRDVSEVGPGYGFTPEMFEKQFGADFSKLPDAKC